MKKVLLMCVIAGTSIFSCTTKTEVNPDNATTISGTYPMTTYKTQSGPSTSLSGNNLVVTKVDNNTVKVVIDYASGTDVEMSGMAITKSGSDYKLSQSFSNATTTGTISGSKFTFDMIYTNGNFVNITAAK